MFIINKLEKNYKQMQRFFIVVHLVAGFDTKGEQRSEDN